MPDLQSEMLQRITRVETKVDEMGNKLDRAITANETAIEALASAKSAHHRLDKIEANQTWMWRTIGGAILVAIVAFIIGGGLKP